MVSRLWLGALAAKAPCVRRLIKEAIGAEERRLRSRALVHGLTARWRRRLVDRRAAAHRREGRHPSVVLLFLFLSPLRLCLCWCGSADTGCWNCLWCLRLHALLESKLLYPLAEGGLQTLKVVLEVLAVPLELSQVPVGFCGEGAHFSLEVVETCRGSSVAAFCGVSG